MARALAPGDLDEVGDRVLAPGDLGETDRVPAPGDPDTPAPGDLDEGVRVQGPGDLVPEEEV